MNLQASGESEIRSLVIIGAGGHGRETLDIVEAINRQKETWKFQGFLADGETRPELSSKRGALILGGVTDLKHWDAEFVIGIGLGKARKEIDEFATSIGKRPATLIHPTASLGSQIQMDPGCVIWSGALLSTNVRIGSHVHIDLGASVSHDVEIGSFSTICPGVRIAGWVQIEEGVTIGIGAVLKDRIRIGKDAIIGAGSVVIHDVPAGITVAGVPAKPLHSTEAIS
jgi:sugar O-acyltransferase (sialic acid O-acetyltransferase NeuD family)